GGESGDGIISCGEILTKAMARSGREIYTFRTYPAEIRGGHSMFQVRVSDDLLLSQGDDLDVLVAFNQEAYARHGRLLKPGGVLVYDRDDFAPDSSGPAGSPAGAQYGLPLTTLARVQAGSPRSKNMVMLGVLAQLFDLDPGILRELIRERFQDKSAAVQEANVKALDVGWEYARTSVPKRDPYRIGSVAGRRRLVLSGNEAVALGALVAGCRFYAGYPITPATDIFEWLAANLPRFGGTVVQSEDEIAALGMALGASFAGAKAMTATSGPGLSLMVEMLGLAGMVEVPVVVVDVQRAGPSTGMPTKAEQGDLNLAVFGAHGDAPRIVLAPTSVMDAFYTTIRAFNMAERYQVPVILLSDQYLGYRTASVDEPDLDRIPLESRLQAHLPGQAPAAGAGAGAAAAAGAAAGVGTGADGRYRRYLDTETGISPTGIPGQEGLMYSATGLEHDEFGVPGYDPGLHQRMTAKRLRKIRTAADDPDLVRVYGTMPARLGILGWGSQEGVIREAVARANGEGYPVAALHTKILHPLPVERIQQFVDSVEAVLVPELNATGQYAGLLRRQIDFQGKPVIRLNKVQGLPFSPVEIYKKVVEACPGGRDTAQAALAVGTAVGTAAQAGPAQSAGKGAHGNHGHRG
ncbi:MAG: 2-oxoacid:acceptor oxidoreductase subunit alpha, partial [Firmicutes bacterium]|nr:2-oxoacid:acceptor oxidoreductase subunit alpha [Bacillota bacterium]